MNERRKTLEKLVTLDGDLNAITKNLSQFEWDSESELIQLTAKDIIVVLERYLDGGLSGSDVENWANALEGREDIGYDSDKDDIIKDSIFDLANPDLSESLSKNFVRKIIHTLSI